MSICAICHSTNKTLRLCARCRRDPANRDWIDREDEEVGREFDLGSNERLRLQPLALWLNRRSRKPTELSIRIVRMLMLGRPVIYRDICGRRRGIRWRRVVSARRIATELGCSFSYVAKIRKRLVAELYED